VDLSYSIVTTASTGLTTVFVKWSSYTNKGGNGFTFHDINWNNNMNLLNILQFGNIPITISYAFWTFKGRISAVDVPRILTTSMSLMFYYSTATSYGSIDKWDVSGVTNFQSTFQFSTFNQYIGSWNVSKATTMSSMFSQNGFNQDISNWNVSKVTDFSSMFYTNQGFNQPIGKWNTSSATSMNAMFYGSNFSQDISKWNTQNVTTIENIFNGITSVVPNIGGWNYTKIKNVNNFVTTPAIRTPLKILAITALFRALSNNPTYCLGTDPELPLLNIPSMADIVTKLAAKGYILVPIAVDVFFDTVYPICVSVLVVIVVVGNETLIPPLIALGNIVFAVILAPDITGGCENV
jgi:surface protein